MSLPVPPAFRFLLPKILPLDPTLPAFSALIQETQGNSLVPKSPGQKLIAFSSPPPPFRTASPTARGDEASCKSLYREHGVPYSKERHLPKATSKLTYNLASVFLPGLPGIVVTPPP